MRINRKCTFHDGGRSILDFETLLAILNCLIKLHQINWKCNEFDSEHVYDVEKLTVTKNKMAAAAI